MRAFLQQQAICVLLLGTPASEIAVAVTDEMAAPYGLDISDYARIDDFLHFQDKLHVTHIVAHEKFRLCSVCAFENAVAAFKRYRHGFFEIYGLAGFQRGDCYILMLIITGHDENRVQVFSFE